MSHDDECHRTGHFGYRSGGHDYVLSAQGAGRGGEIRATDIYGRRLVVGPLPIKANVTQRSILQFAEH